MNSKSYEFQAPVKHEGQWPIERYMDNFVPFLNKRTVRSYQKILILSNRKWLLEIKVK